MSDSGRDYYEEVDDNDDEVVCKYQSVSGTPAGPGASLREAEVTTITPEVTGNMSLSKRRHPVGTTEALSISSQIGSLSRYSGQEVMIPCVQRSRRLQGKSPLGEFYRPEVKLTEAARKIVPERPAALLVHDDDDGRDDYDDDDVASGADEPYSIHL